MKSRIIVEIEDDGETTDFTVRSEVDSKDNCCLGFFLVTALMHARISEAVKTFDADHITLTEVKKRLLDMAKLDMAKSAGEEGEAYE